MGRNRMTCNFLTIYLQGLSLFSLLCLVHSTKQAPALGKGLLPVPKWGPSDLSGLICQGLLESSRPVK